MEPVLVVCIAADPCRVIPTRHVTYVTLRHVVLLQGTVLLSANFFGLRRGVVWFIASLRLGAARLPVDAPERFGVGPMLGTVGGTFS